MVEGRISTPPAKVQQKVGCMITSVFTPADTFSSMVTVSVSVTVTVTYVRVGLNVPSHGAVCVIVVVTTRIP